MTQVTIERELLERIAVDLNILTSEEGATRKEMDAAINSLKYLRAALQAAPAQPVNQVLVDALRDAATSLETISRLAGRTHYVGDDGERAETYMGHHDEVRGYAASRAGVARTALAQAQAQQSAEDPRENPYFQQLALEAKSSL